MKYKAVVFDLDGTLLNTLEDLTDSTNFALQKCGFPERSIDEIRTFVGNGISLLIKRAVPDNTNEADFNKCFDIFCEHYKGNMLNKTRPYDNVLTLLDNLKKNGIKTAVVTNKAEFACRQICSEMFGGRLDAVIGARDGLEKKPAPDGVNLALETLGVDREDAVFVGDSEVDIQTAFNAKIDCIAVLWGFRTAEQLNKLGVKCSVNSVFELEKLILF